MKQCSAASAVAMIGDGMRVFVGSGAAVPFTLIEAFCARALELHDIEICQLLALGAAPYAAPEFADHVRHNAFFIGVNVREAVTSGRADFTPVFLSEIAGLLRGPLQREGRIVC